MVNSGGMQTTVSSADDNVLVRDRFPSSMGLHLSDCQMTWRTRGLQFPCPCKASISARVRPGSAMPSSISACVRSHIVRTCLDGCRMASTSSTLRTAPSPKTCSSGSGSGPLPIWRGAMGRKMPDGGMTPSKLETLRQTRWQALIGPAHEGHHKSDVHWPNARCPPQLDMSPRKNPCIEGAQCPRDALYDTQAGSAKRLDAWAVGHISIYHELQVSLHGWITSERVTQLRRELFVSLRSYPPIQEIGGRQLRCGRLMLVLHRSVHGGLHPERLDVWP